MKKLLATAIAATLFLSACSSNGNNSVTTSTRNDSNPAETETTITNASNSALNETDVKEETTTEETTETKLYKQEGDYIIFGNYEQDGDESNGPEPIEWMILSNKDGKMLLLSRYILDHQDYHDHQVMAVTWENCKLRSWLNNDFFNKAFSKSEQNKIITAKLTNPDNPLDGTDGGNDTEDKIFCLSTDEVHTYFNFEDQEEIKQSLMAEPTLYAQLQYVLTIKDHASWWLRSPGRTADSNGATAQKIHLAFNPNMKDYDLVSSFYVKYGGRIGVRPALYLSAE